MSSNEGKWIGREFKTILGVLDTKQKTTGQVTVFNLAYGRKFDHFKQ